MRREKEADRKEKRSKAEKVSRALIEFRRLEHTEIESYVETGEPFDKAGGYGAQGVGSLLIEKVDGCFYNVVGFPLGKFFHDFDKFLSDIK